MKTTLPTIIAILFMFGAAPAFAMCQIGGCAPPPNPPGWVPNFNPSLDRSIPDPAKIAAEQRWHDRKQCLELCHPWRDGTPGPCPTLCQK